MHRSHSIARPASLLAASLLVLAACGSDDDDSTGSSMATPDGLVITASTRPVDETIGALETAIMGNDNLSVVARVDHGASAAGAQLELRATEVLLFGNPALGTQLMLENQQAGLDLPQKMLAYQDELGQTQLAYNGSAYLRARHSLSTVDEALGTIDGALAMLAGGASGATVDASGAAQASVAAGDGIETMASNRSFDETHAALIQAIEEAAPLNIAAQLDHSANAASVGLTLRPTRLVVFGNPAAGTPLMQSMQSVGIDLPQKMLVYEAEDGSVTIAWNDPDYLARRHAVDADDAALQTIAGALEGLAAQAAGEATDES